MEEIRLNKYLSEQYALKTEYKKLDAERERLSAQYSEAKQKLKEYGIVKQNIDSILRTAPGKCDGRRLQTADRPRRGKGHFGQSAGAARPMIDDAAV